MRADRKALVVEIAAAALMVDSFFGPRDSAVFELGVALILIAISMVLTEFAKWSRL